MSKKISNQDDPRVIRTRNLLRQAFIDLVSEKGFDAVTIGDIAERATLNRATFYLHYDHKDELLLDVFEEIFIKAVPDPPPNQEMALKAGMEPLLIVLNHVAEYAHFYHQMLGDKGVPTFMAHVQDYIQEIMGKWIPELADSQHNRIISEIAVTYISSAFLGVIAWWLEHDMPYPPDQMAEHLFRLTGKGIFGVLNLPPQGEI